MTFRAKAYIALIVALGAASAAYGLANWSVTDPVRFLLYTFLAVIGSGLKVRLPRVFGTFSVLFVFLLAGIVEVGLSGTIVMSIVAGIVQSFWHAKYRPKPVHLLFSVSVLCLATTTGHFAYTWERLATVHQSLSLSLALLASVFFLTNTLPVAGVISLTEGRPFGPTWTATYSWVFPYYLVGAALVALFGVINRLLNWPAWFLILPAVYAIYRSYYLYVDRLENESLRAEAERRHGEEIAELLTQTMSANEALKRADDDLQQFAYAASHDLQEPLRMILIYSELLQRRHSAELSSDANKLLGTIGEGAQRINALVKDLLSYTRVSALEQITAPLTETGDVFTEVEKALEAGIQSLHAVVTSGDLAPVAVHRTHLVQILQNLISNSLKYHAHTRAPRVHVSTSVAEAGMVQISICDNGIGIAPVYHDRIFGVFKRLHSRDIPGTGIGLAICRRIVSYYGGKIWVESTGSDGSTFHFTVPAAPPDIPADDPQIMQQRHERFEGPALATAMPG